MKKQKYDKPENVQKRTRAYRQRMKEKGFRYLSFWVPEGCREVLQKFIDGLSIGVQGEDLRPTPVDTTERR